VLVFAKLTWIEIKLLAREPLTLIFTFALPLLILLVLGGIFGENTLHHAPGLGGRPAIDWYVPAYIGLVAASIGLISLPVHLASYRERGVLRRFRASGVSEWSILGSQLIVSLGIGIIGALLLAVEGGLVYGGDSPLDLPQFALAYMISIAMFAALGVLLAAVIPSSRAVQGLGLILWFMMMFLSGTGSPLDLLPTWLLRIGQALPLYHVVLALEYPWNGQGTNATQLAIVGGAAIVLIVLAARLFRWE
jgi:ABC-2 type transport system permease protein